MKIKKGAKISSISRLFSLSLFFSSSPQCTTTAAATAGEKREKKEEEEQEEEEEGPSWEHQRWSLVALISKS